MKSMNYERLLSFGHVIPLNISCDREKIIEEIKDFSFSQYNGSKPDNPRLGLSVTSLDGSINGVDLDSLYELNKRTDNHFDECSFKKLTAVYDMSEEVQKLVDPWKDHLARTHFLNIKKGGYFPPHRDDRGYDEQHTFRIVVPIRHCNQPKFYFMMNGEIVNFVEGHAYFMNTNLMHSAFSYSNDNLMLVMNIMSNEKSLSIVAKNFMNV